MSLKNSIPQEIADLMTEVMTREQLKKSLQSSIDTVEVFSAYYHDASMREAMRDLLNVIIEQDAYIDSLDWRPKELFEKEGTQVIGWLSTKKGFQDTTAILIYLNGCWHWGDEGDDPVKCPELIKGVMPWPELPVKFSNGDEEITREQKKYTKENEECSHLNLEKHKLHPKIKICLDCGAGIIKAKQG